MHRGGFEPITSAVVSRHFTTVPPERVSVFFLSYLNDFPGVIVLQRRLGDAAKKAISKLQVRTIKKGDKVKSWFQ